MNTPILNKTKEGQQLATMFGQLTDHNIRLSAENKRLVKIIENLNDRIKTQREQMIEMSLSLKAKSAIIEILNEKQHEIPY